MTRKPIPFDWLGFSFLGYGIVGFYLAAIASFYGAPLTTTLISGLMLTALTTLILSFGAAWATGLIVVSAIAVSAIIILLTVYFWGLVLYWRATPIAQVLYLVALGIGLGTVWMGMGGLVQARNELAKEFKKLQTFWVLTIASLSGIGLGWLIGWLALAS